MRLVKLLALCAPLLACRAEPLGNVSITLGKEQAGTRSFDVRSAFAEYLELPGLRRELRITLSSFEANCESSLVLPPDAVLVVVTVAAPTTSALAPGSYDWAGHDAHGGTPEQPARPYSVPIARLGERGYEFQPGGGVELKQVGTQEGEQVRGLLNFEFPGDADRAAQGLKGSFDARVCRSSDAPADD